MNFEQEADATSAVVGTLFVLLCGIYLLAAFLARRGNVSAYRWIVLENAFVCGLTAFNYVYAIGSGDTSIRWIAYSLCSSVLLLTIFGWKTRFAPEKSYPALLWAALGANVVTVVSGYFIAGPGIEFGYRLGAYAMSFIPFVLTFLLLTRAIREETRRSQSLWAGWAPFFLFFWLVYPVGYILSPVLLNVINVKVEQFIYVMADVITKLSFGIYYGWLAYRFFLGKDAKAYRKVRRADGGASDNACRTNGNQMRALGLSKDESSDDMSEYPSKYV